MTSGGYIHADLVSTDPKATRAFYETVFGWKFRTIPLTGYSLWEARSPPNGGLRKPEHDERPGMLGYVAVDSLDDARQRIRDAGGTILTEDRGVPGFGRFFLFQAPGGIVQGAFEEKAA
jgi:predicted enzyme related to lactoylglutathione lyase